MYPPLWCECSRRRRLALQLLLRVGPLLPPGSGGKSALCAPACPGGRRHAGHRRNKTRRRKSISHAMLPSPALPHAAAGFTRVEFKESLQRQLFGLLSMGITCHQPRPAPSHRPAWHLPGPKSSSSCQTVLRPREPELPSCNTRRDFLI